MTKETLQTFFANGSNRNVEIYICYTQISGLFASNIIVVYNAITLNIFFIKGSHKYDVYWRDKNKAYRS